MPEQRGRQHHRERVGETLKEEISVIIEGELGDPRIALCNVTEIVLAPDGKSARVFIEVAGDEQAAEQTLKAINAAKGFIRHEMLVRLGGRHVDDLSFVHNPAQEDVASGDDIINKIKKRMK